MTQSAASISSGLALRPVTTTCRPGRRATSAATTSASLQIVVAQRDVEFVEHDEADRRVGHHAPGLAPRGFSRRDVARAVLRLPGEAFAHRAPLDLGPEALDAHALAGRPGALDELHHADAKAPPERAQDEPEGRGRLALAGAGVDDEEPLLENGFAATSASCTALRLIILALWRSAASVTGVYGGGALAVQAQRLARPNERRKWAAGDPRRDRLSLGSERRAPHDRGPRRKRRRADPVCSGRFGERSERHPSERGVVLVGDLR